MNKVVLFVFSFLILFSSNSYAGMTCKTDWKGDYVCTHDDGYQTTTKQDWKGNDVTTDSYGNKITCKTNWKGDYVCN